MNASGVKNRSPRSRAIFAGLSLGRRFTKDQSGVAAIEFALCFTLLAVMVDAVGELSMYVQADRNVAAICSTVGDLTGQAQATSPADMRDEFSIANQMMAPAPVGNLSIRVTSVVPKIQGGRIIGAQVGWCQASGSSLPCRPKGSGVTTYRNGASFPISMLPTLTSSVISTEISYTYDSPLATLIPNGANIYKLSFENPRIVAHVQCGTC